MNKGDPPRRRPGSIERGFLGLAEAFTGPREIEIRHLPRSQRQRGADMPGVRGKNCQGDERIRR